MDLHHAEKEKRQRIGSFKCLTGCLEDAADQLAETDLSNPLEHRLCINLLLLRL